MAAAEYTLTGSQIRSLALEDNRVVVRGRGALKITYKIWADKLRVADGKLKLAGGAKVIVNELRDDQKAALARLGVTVEEKTAPKLVWKSGAFETNYFGARETVAGKTYNDTFGVFRISPEIARNDLGEITENVESQHVPYVRVGEIWHQPRSAPWLIVHLASGLCVACVTSENVAKAKVEDAYADGTRELRSSVDKQIAEFVAEEAGKI